jgi:hypothetical protein
MWTESVQGGCRVDNDLLVFDRHLFESCAHGIWPQSNLVTLDEFIPEYNSARRVLLMITILGSFRDPLFGARFFPVSEILPSLLEGGLSRHLSAGSRLVEIYRSPRDALQIKPGRAERGHQTSVMTTPKNGNSFDWKRRASLHVGASLSDNLNELYLSNQAEF